MRHLKQNKKGEMTILVKIVLWLIFFVVAGIAVYSLIKFILGLG
jgi:hypothetical protein